MAAAKWARRLSWAAAPWLGLLIGVEDLVVVQHQGVPPPGRVSNRPQVKAPQTLLVARWRRRPAPLVSGRRGGAKKPSSRTLSGVQHAQKVAELVGARQNGRNHLTVQKSCCHRQLLRWTTIMAGGTAQAAPKSRGCTLSASWWLQTA